MQQDFAACESQRFPARRRRSSRARRPLRRDRNKPPVRRTTPSPPRSRPRSARSSPEQEMTHSRPAARRASGRSSLRPFFHRVQTVLRPPTRRFHLALPVRRLHGVPRQTLLCRNGGNGELPKAIQPIAASPPRYCLRDPQRLGYASPESPSECENTIGPALVHMQQAPAAVPIHRPPSRSRRSAVALAGLYRRESGTARLSR